MNDTLIFALVVCACGLIIVALIARYMRNKLLDRILDLLNSKRYEDFDRLMDSKRVKLAFDPFNVDYIKMNAYLIRNDKEKIDGIFKHFDSVNLRPDQRDDIDLKAFNYYLSINDDQNAKKYYGSIMDSKTNKVKKETERLYSIYVEKDQRFLDELLEETKGLDDRYKSANELLIAAIYGNMGDIKKQQMYERLAKEHLR